jgi:hypothetical protein
MPMSEQEPDTTTVILCATLLGPALGEVHHPNERVALPQALAERLLREKLAIDPRPEVRFPHVPGEVWLKLACRLCHARYGNFEIGSEVRLPLSEAQRLLDLGHAERLFPATSLIAR